MKWILPSGSVAALQLALRAAVAAGVSVQAARWLDLLVPLYAMIAAVIVTDLDPARTRALALPRIAGTIVGASVGAFACEWLPRSPWAVAFGICVSMLACQAMRMKDAAVKLAGYVSGIVLLEHVGEPWVYGGHRLMETMIGIGAAVAVSLVPKLIRTPPPAQSPPGPG